MTDSIVCPRCGLEQAQAAECINCGAVFAKLKPEPSVRPVETAASASKPRGALIGGLLLAALAIAVALLFLPRSPSPAPAAASAPSEPLPKERRAVRLPSGWYEGAAGYQKAFQEAREGGRPVAVYFYTDWCGYCQQLDEELLSHPQVQEKLRSLVKVKINPEKGFAERDLAEKYEVGGYPAFFILPSADGQAQMVEGMVQEGDGWRLRTPEDFVAVCYKAAGI